MKGIRGLVLGMLAVAALAALPASALASVGVVADQYTATLNGSELAGHKLTLTGFGGGGMECEKAGFEAQLKGPASTLTTSSVKNPSCAGGSLQMNGCQFELNPGGSGSVGIGPSGCGPVTFSVTNCLNYKLPPQSGISATYENVGSGSETHFNVLLDDSSVEYVADGYCMKAGTYKNLRIKGGLTVAATTAEKKSTGTSAITGGLFLAGASESKLEAVEYPVSVTGERWHIGGLNPLVKLLTVSHSSGVDLGVACNQSTYDGGELTKAVANFALTPTYSECDVLEFPAVVSMSSCHYAYSGFEQQGTNYKGAVELACNKGDAIKVTSEVCSFTIPPQKLSGGASFVDTNIGKEANVTGGMTEPGIEYTAQGGLCFILGISSGTYKNGESQSGMLLRGEFPG